jgi:hypothetical protein
MMEGYNGGHGSIWYNSLSCIGNHRFSWFPFKSKIMLNPLPFNIFLAAAIYAIESSDMPGPNLEVTKIIRAMLASAKKIMACIEYLKYLSSFI